MKIRITKPLDRTQHQIGKSIDASCELECPDPTSYTIEWLLSPHYDKLKRGEFEENVQLLSKESVIAYGASVKISTRILSPGKYHLDVRVYPTARSGSNEWVNDLLIDIDSKVADDGVLINIVEELLN